LERYRALDTLAATVFQIGVAAFIGGVAVGLSVKSSFYRGVIIALGIFPLVCGSLAGLAMVDDGDDHPTTDSLTEKRLTVNHCAVLLVASVCGAVLMIGLLLDIAGELR
jgi:hypothetical protein